MKGWNPTERVILPLVWLLSHLPWAQNILTLCFLFVVRIRMLEYAHIKSVCTKICCYYIHASSPTPALFLLAEISKRPLAVPTQHEKRNKARENDTTTVKSMSVKSTKKRFYQHIIPTCRSLGYCFCYPREWRHILE